MVAGNGDVAPPSWTWFGTSGVTPQEEWEFRLRYCAVFADSLILAFSAVSGWGIQEVLCHGDVEDLPGSEQPNSFCAPA